MSRLGVIDDRADLRRNFCSLIESRLPSEWEVVQRAPFVDIAETIDWIDEEQISCLVVDWRLHRACTIGEQPVDYEGDRVVEEIRRLRPDFPIFMVTSFLGEMTAEGLVEKTGDVEGLVERPEDRRSFDALSKRIIRASNRYVQAESARHGRLSVLCEKMAVAGSLETAESEELNSLRGYFGLRGLDGVESVALVVGDAERTLERMRTLLEEVASRSVDASEDEDVDQD